MLRSAQQTASQFCFIAFRRTSIEAEIFIDGIYKQLKSLGITCYTKHDSILYKPSDKEVVESVIAMVFDRYRMHAKMQEETYEEPVKIKRRKAA